MGQNGRSEPKRAVDVSDEGLAKVRRWGLWINVSTFLIGYVTGVIAGALLYISGDLNLDKTQQGLVTSILLLGAMVAASLTGGLADRYGRRMMLGVAAVLFALGLAVAALASGFGALMVGRLVMGLGVGVASALAPTYLGEISPAQIRGRMLTLNQLMQTVGMLVAYVVNFVFSSSGDWRAMFWVGIVPAVLLAVVATRLPDSPVWLVRTGRADDARNVVQSVTGDEGADRVIERYRSEDAEHSDEHRTGLRALLARRVRPALIVGLGLAVLQQFVGINTVLYYAPTIMRQTGLGASNSIVYSIIIGAVNLAMTVVSLRLIDRVGRRPLLIVSLIGMAISVGGLAMAFLFDLSSIVMLVCMLIFVSSFAVGMGPVFWVILGEIFPPQARAEGTGAGSAANWLSNFAVSTAFLPLAQAIGTGKVFLIFAAVCLLGLWFVGRYVPETKDRNFQQVDAELQARVHGG